MRFFPCAGREHCTDEGTHCRGCGRALTEVARTRELIALLVEEANGYENAEEYLDYLARKAAKTIAWRRG